MEFTGTDQTLRFGSFELDVRSRELRKGRTSIRLQEQPFEILCMMLERPGHVVTRDELRKRLWPEGTFVDFEHSLNAAVKRLRAALGDDADNPRFVETLPRRGYRFIGALEEAEAGAVDVGGPAPRVRLAVLPFTCLTQEGGQEYFADGLTEEMIAQLGQLCRGRIGVIARWSSMFFKETTLRTREIGQALSADYLLEGSVRRESDRVRITARLVEARGETHLWAESYERHLTDCLSVQADVAARIARSLALELAPEQPDDAHAHASKSAQAYQEYLKGRYHWNKPDYGHGVDAPYILDQALSGFARALHIDPSFAPAHAMVARVHIARAQQYTDVPRRLLEIGRASAKRAVELDPAFPEAHLALGDIRRMLEWDWRGAEQEYMQAIALNPSAENAHRRYSLMLVVQSRDVDAIREAERACELDPLCLVVGASAALVRLLAGDYQGAIERCQHTFRLEPQYLPAQRLVGAAHLMAGRVSEGIAALEAAHAEVPTDHVSIAWLVHACALAGDGVSASRWMGRLQELGRTRYISPYHLAVAHVGLGELDSAFAALERATVDADPALAYVAVEPRFEPLRQDDRYSRLLTLLGL